MHHGSDSHCGVRVCPPPADDDVMDGGGVSGVIWNRVLLLFYGASFGSFRSTPVSVLSLSAGGAVRQRPSSIVRMNPTTPLFYFS